MGQKMLDGLKVKTGRDRSEWVELIKAKGPGDNKACVAWLKSEHMLGTNYAKMLWDLAQGQNQAQYDSEAYLRAAPGYIEAMVSGKREALRPVWESVFPWIRSLGDDVECCPGKTIIPFYRGKVFAQIKPGSLRRLDLGLALGKIPQTKPEVLKSTGGLEKGDRITHRFELTCADDFTDEVKDWLRRAYDSLG